jgi:hypothetical protein
MSRRRQAARLITCAKFRLTQSANIHHGSFAINSTATFEGEASFCIAFKPAPRKLKVPLKSANACSVRQLTGCIYFFVLERCYEF